ncbi:MAG: family 65 glycosyl hydrolase [Clostridiales bacterium]|jgi:alpha,alpha-trehalose phosphorylase|nr:family 65 glycosyl hydrolase [Clostridiales bacterium]
MNPLVYAMDGFNPDNRALMTQETIFHNANGLIGIRSCFEEGYPEGMASIRGTYINGVYGVSEMKQAEKLYGFAEEKETIVNVADVQSIEAWVGGERFTLFEGSVLNLSRVLDMEAGITARKAHWRSPEGKEVKAAVTRMASFERPEVFLLEYALEAVNFAGPIRIVSKHIGDVVNYSNPDDPRVASESVKHLSPGLPELLGGASYVKTLIPRSGISFCSGVKNVFSKPGDETIEVSGTSAVHSFSCELSEGETVVLRKYCVFTDDRRHEDIEKSAIAILSEAVSAGAEALLLEQRAYLDSFWDRSMLKIEGDDSLSSSICFNLYQLMASAGRDQISSIAAKGLSGEGYEGHYFWDAEMYIQPFFILTNPEIAKSLISYRYSCLGKARENARIMGHKSGALYPWRTITGSECSGYYPSGSAQYHINGDIAYAVTSYYLATKDLETLANMGAEILYETARLWLDAGTWNGSRFELHDMTGPDEYTCIVNNNYYTNLAAKHNLLWAEKAHKLLKEAGMGFAAEKIGLGDSEVQDFKTAGLAMYLPYDEKLGINPQDDSFLTKKVWDFEGTPKDHYPLLLHYHPLHLYRHQVSKQADTVLAHFIFQDAQSLDVIRRSFDYYEKITTHDSSLSSCIFSIVASTLGLRDKAFKYFGKSAYYDLFDTAGNTQDGIHTANMGGVYMAAVYGFAGFRLKEDGVHFAPYLPEGWTRYSFKIQHEGCRISVVVEKDASVFTALGKSKNIKVNGAECALEAGKPVSIPNLSN